MLRDVTKEQSLQIEVLKFVCIGMGDSYLIFARQAPVSASVGGDAIASGGDSVTKLEGDDEQSDP